MKRKSTEAGSGRAAALYLHAPTRTDPSLAPPECECFYVLSPVPHLGGGQDWDAIRDEYGPPEGFERARKERETRSGKRGRSQKPCQGHEDARG